MKILHLVSDHQVIERALNLYERVFPGQNEVIIFSGSTPLRHIEAHKDCPVLNIRTVELFAKSYDFSNINYVIAHYMSLDKIDFIKFVPENIHVSWEIYGGDLYNQFLVRQGYKLYYTDPYRYGTYKLLNILYPRCRFLVNFNAKVFRHRKYSFDFELKRQFDFITKRINSLGLCCRSDKDILEQYAHRTFPYFEVFNFSLKETLGQLYDCDFTHGNNILIGNSASFTNNHLYVLNFLRKLDINSSRKVILPLPYGGSKKYKDKVINEYSKYLPDNCQFMINYLPIDQYYGMFLGLSTMVMSSWRQESWGNIIIGLYLGIKIYMSNQNMFYKWLVEIGFKIYAIEETNSEEFSKPLSLEYMQHNRNLVLKRYREEVVSENFKNHFK
ncbi:TDP-N-acetylfucosamine:lipid II N-acetylfucosaminyltransferase [Bacteroides heparinolyticus]|uniref:TDP-N-acetylfucosamine:lipid II N-acetylfucosaminyltransferase n=1 Tax=Prevotella heparinolytica TaxID=28113 RepID=UPI0023F62580|nr:TDP-N-acetylfucosamine:lipid II N-acetylfucosaminyltransferase [Bacteroides heparinolyticus]MCI6213150.1 TDP-N-acetylfucosamine:lipid II N-acetylfucosaminyltransferase [Bacteroides heparinolyticus]